MITSIQHFCENGVKRLTNVFKTYTDDLTKIAEMVYGVTENSQHPLSRSNSS